MPNDTQNKENPSLSSDISHLILSALKHRVLFWTIFLGALVVILFLSLSSHKGFEGTFGITTGTVPTIDSAVSGRWRSTLLYSAEENKNLLANLFPVTDRRKCGTGELCVLNVEASPQSDRNLIVLISGPTQASLLEFSERVKGAILSEHSRRYQTYLNSFQEREATLRHFYEAGLQIIQTLFAKASQVARKSSTEEAANLVTSYLRIGHPLELTLLELEGAKFARETHAFNETKVDLLKVRPAAFGTTPVGRIVSVVASLGFAFFLALLTVSLWIWLGKIVSLCRTLSLAQNSN